MVGLREAGHSRAGASQSCSLPQKRREPGATVSGPHKGGAWRWLPHGSRGLRGGGHGRAPTTWQRGRRGPSIRTPARRLPGTAAPQWPEKSQDVLLLHSLSPGSREADGVVAKAAAVFTQQRLAGARVSGRERPQTLLSHSGPPRGWTAAGLGPLCKQRRQVTPAIRLTGNDVPCDPSPRASAGFVYWQQFVN